MQKAFSVYNVNFCTALQKSLNYLDAAQSLSRTSANVRNYLTSTLDMTSEIRIEANTTIIVCKAGDDVKRTSTNGMVFYPHIIQELKQCRCIACAIYSWLQ